MNGAPANYVDASTVQFIARFAEDRLKTSL